MRRLRGFSLIELVTTFVIVAILSSVAVSYFRNATKDIDDSLAKRTLESAATLELTYHDSRGVFATTATELSLLSGDEVTLQLSPSDGQTSVSVYVLGDDELGLAVLSAPDRCLTLVVGVSGPGEEPEARNVMAASECVGQLAGS